MNNSQEEKKQSNLKEKIKQIAKALLIGTIESGLAAGLVFLLALANDWATFAVFALWLVMGWFTTNFIQINTLEIVSTMVSIVLISFLIYFFGGITFWFIPILIGLSILFWVISFVTKLFLYPDRGKSDEKEAEIEK